MDDKYVYLIGSVGNGTIDIVYATMSHEKAIAMLNRHPDSRFLWKKRLHDDVDDGERHNNSDVAARELLSKFTGLPTDSSIDEFTKKLIFGNKEEQK